MNRSPSDADLIDAVRNGTISAYGELYERHVSAAYNLARHLSRSSAQADDLVSEAFAKVLETIRSGRGPDSAFRAYLLTALRHTSYDIVRRDRKIELAEDVSEVDGISIEALRVPFIDPAVAGLERALAARAFARLPERWQAVLWHTQIEDQSPAEVAPILGLTPHGVSALAYRAREGLKQAYLQVYLADTTEQRCRATVDRLGAWIRGGLAKREKAQVESHLDECARCVALAEELANISGTMRAFIAPLVLGSGTAGYLTAGAGTMVAGPAGGGPATTLPRQFLGIVGSVLALIAALIIGLTAGDPTEPPSTTVPPAPAPVPPEPPAPPGPPTFAPIPPPGPVPPATTPTIGGG